MHSDHHIFVRAIKDKKKVLLDYFDEKIKLNFAKLCVPVHYKSSRTEGGDLDCYYLWDSGGKIGKRFLGLSPSQIISMELTEETFDPQKIISMEPTREKDSELAKLAECLVEKIRKTSLSEEKEPTEESE